MDPNARIVGPGVDYLNDLRWDSASGDLNAEVELINRLLDLFERGGNPQHLFEAILWLDRDWTSPRFGSRAC